MLALRAVPRLVVIRSHATRALAGAAEQTFSQPAIASLVPYRKSQPAFVGGGAIRSRRLGNRQPFGGATGAPSASTARRSRRASFGSAWTSAVARHSWTSWLSGS